MVAMHVPSHLSIAYLVCVIFVTRAYKYYAFLDGHPEFFSSPAVKSEKS